MTWKKYNSFFFKCQFRSTQFCRFFDVFNCDFTRIIMRFLFWNFFIFIVNKFKKDFKNFFILQDVRASLRHNCWMMTLSIKSFSSFSKVFSFIFWILTYEVSTFSANVNLSVFVTLRMKIDFKLIIATIIFLNLFCNVKRHISSFTSFL